MPARRPHRVGQPTGWMDRLGTLVAGAFTGGFVGFLLADPCLPDASPTAGGWVLFRVRRS